MRSPRAFVASLVPLLLIGCTSMMKDPDEPILITSTPPGARVTVNGAYIGQTPVSMTRKAEDFALVIEHADCAPHTSQVKATTDAGAVAASVASGVLLIGVFEAISLADGGSSLYSDIPDVVNVPLVCDAATDTVAAEPELPAP